MQSLSLLLLLPLWPGEGLAVRCSATGSQPHTLVASLTPSLSPSLSPSFSAGSWRCTSSTRPESALSPLHCLCHFCHASYSSFHKFRIHCTDGLPTCRRSCPCLSACGSCCRHAPFCPPPCPCLCPPPCPCLSPCLLLRHHCRCQQQQHAPCCPSPSHCLHAAPSLLQAQPEGLQLQQPAEGAGLWSQPCSHAGSQLQSGAQVQAGQQQQAWAPAGPHCCAHCRAQRRAQRRARCLCLLLLLCPPSRPRPPSPSSCCLHAAAGQEEAQAQAQAQSAAAPPCPSLWACLPLCPLGRQRAAALSAPCAEEGSWRGPAAASLQRLQRLQRLQPLQSLQHLQLQRAPCWLWQPRSPSAASG